MELCANPYSDCSSSSSMTTVCASSSHKRASLPLADITPKSTLMFSIQPKTYSSSELVHGTGAQEDEYSYRSDRIPRNTEMLKAELNMYTNVIMSLFALIPIMALLSLISTHSAIHTRCVEKKLFFGILLSLLIPINTAMGKIEYGDATSYGTSSGGTSGGGGSSNGDDGTTSLPINRQPHDWKVHEHDRAGYSNQQTTSRSSWVLQWIAEKQVGGGKLFEGAAAWYECENGYVLGGFERLTNNCQSLHCIQQMKCVTPAVPLVPQSCYVKDISLTFDNGGAVDCNDGSYDGYFIRGMWAKDNDWFECGLECWEKLRCCKYDETRLVADTSALTQDWSACFDYNSAVYNSKSWCLVDSFEYITGFHRSSGLSGWPTGGGQIKLLKEANVRTIMKTADWYVNPTLRSSWVLQWIAVKEVGGGKLFEGAAAWYECDNGYVLGGLEKTNKLGGCQSLYCIEQMKCVTPAVPLVSQSCYVKDISLTFDNGGTVDCNGGSYDGYFIRGMWANDNGNLACGLQCWEKLRCCKYDETRLVADTS
eukprot:622678_1